MLRIFIIKLDSDSKIIVSKGVAIFRLGSDIEIPILFDPTELESQLRLRVGELEVPKKEIKQKN